MRFGPASDLRVARETCVPPEKFVDMVQIDLHSPPGTTGLIPNAVIGRLSLYVRELQQLIRQNVETVNSDGLARPLGLTAAQVRKDLAYFGNFGLRGIGYRCGELLDRIRAILGTNQRWPVILVGAGNLGRALLGYRGFADHGYDFIAAFDNDPRKIGTHLAEQIPILNLESARKIVQTAGVRLAVVCVPTDVAQEVVDFLCASGIGGILNFAPVNVSAAKPVQIVNVDLAVELEQLSFAVVQRVRSS